MLLKADIAQTSFKYKLQGSFGKLLSWILTLKKIKDYTKIYIPIISQTLDYWRLSRVQINENAI